MKKKNIENSQRSDNEKINQLKKVKNRLVRLLNTMKLLTKD